MSSSAKLASSSLLVAVPIQTLAFACHTVVFPVYREFRETPGSDPASFQKFLQDKIKVDGRSRTEDVDGEYSTSLTA